MGWSSYGAGMSAKHRLVLVLAFLALLSFPAKAEDCGDKNTQTEMNLCTYNQFLATDTELKSVEAEALARLAGDTKG